MAQILSIGNRALELNKKILTASSVGDNYIIIDGYSYELKKAGSRIWSTEDIKVPLDGTQERSGLVYYTWDHIQAILQKLPSGWRVPGESDWYNLVNNSGYSVAQLKSTTGWNSYPGTNASGLNFLPRGEYQKSGTTPILYDVGRNGYYWCTTGDNAAYQIGTDNYGHKARFSSQSHSWWLAIRICRDA